MATTKSFTSLEQSKKLAEILPIESADGHWYNGSLGLTYSQEAKDFYDSVSNEYLPAWSLSALLGVLPSVTLDSSDNHRYRLRYNERFTEWYDNPIDACIEAIENLREQMIYDFNNS